MDEFGETPTIYIWPKEHKDGDPLPDDFWERVDRALATESLEREVV